MRQQPRTKALTVLALLVLSCSAQALEYRSVLKQGAIYYAAPTDQAKKLFIVSKSSPVEVLAVVNDWLRIRDQQGRLAWMKKSDLGKRTHIVVTKPTTVYSAGNTQSEPVFKAEAGLLLELTENTRIGWLRIRHRDGKAGYIRIEDVWGL